MKSFYAIPKNSIERAQKMSEEYAENLETLSEYAISLGDNLRSFANSTSESQLHISDEEWAKVEQKISNQSKATYLLGKIFWSTDDVKIAADALDNFFFRFNLLTSPLQSWLRSRAKRGNVVLLLTN